MKRKIWLLALVAAVMLSAGIPWAQADFYVIGGGGPVGTKITSLPYTINNSGFYYLGGDLAYTGTSGDAITINSNDVTLDLMGFRLVGPGINTGTGIRLQGRYNVEVRHGTVAGFSYGIWESGSGANQRYINLRTGFNSSGIFLTGNNHLVKNCTSSHNSSIGIFVQGVGLIVENVANNNGTPGFGYGIQLSGAGTLLGNTACNNGSANFNLGNGDLTSILVANNCAYGTSPNYYIPDGTIGVNITSSNSGTP